MKQEHFLILVVGLLILTYVLDAVVNPLPVALITPYHYFNPEIMFTYPFTTTSIILKALALIIASILILSFLGFKKITNGAILLVLAGLMQLYSLQSVVSNSQIIPLEWSISITLAGVVLLFISLFYLITGIVGKFTEDPYSPEENQS